MANDREYRDALSRHLVLPDGIGVDLASFAMHGKMFPANLNGTDFVPALMTYITTPKRIGLVGARPDVLERARKNFAEHAPWHEFVAIRDGFFKDEDSWSISDEIARHKVDILLVAMGSPKQEKWIDRYIRPETRPAGDQRRRAVRFHGRRISARARGCAFAARRVAASGAPGAKTTVESAISSAVRSSPCERWCFPSSSECRQSGWRIASGGNYAIIEIGNPFRRLKLTIC